MRSQLLTDRAVGAALVQDSISAVEAARAAIERSAGLCVQATRLRSAGEERRARASPAGAPTGRAVAAPPARVMVVEHNLDDERLTQRALDAYPSPLRVERFHHGAAARDALAAPGAPPDLVLCDLYLRDLAGDELARWARAQPRLAGLPFVVFSGSVHPADGPRCLAAGASEHRVKPMMLEDYVRCVHGMLARWLPAG